MLKRFENNHTPVVKVSNSHKNRHSPLIIKTTSRSRCNPEMTSDLLLLKAHRRKLERIYIQSHSLIDLYKLRSATNKCHKLINFAKRSFNSNHILKCDFNPRLRWKTIICLLDRSPNLLSLKLHPEYLFHSFCYIFLRKGFQTSSQTSFCSLSHHPHFTPTTTSPRLYSFSPTSVTEMSRLITESTNSYYDLDPIPTNLLKLMFFSISPTI